MLEAAYSGATDLFISPSSIPAFDFDDTDTVHVGTLNLGDEFIAMYTGKHKVVGFTCGLIDAEDSEGRVMHFGATAPVKVIKKGVQA